MQLLSKLLVLQSPDVLAVTPFDHSVPVLQARSIFETGIYGSPSNLFQLANYREVKGYDVEARR